jgi:RNA polymerase II-associated factor 1
VSGFVALLTVRAEDEVDASEAAQILAIDKTFMDIRDQPLSEIRHPDPKKRNLHVVDVGSRLSSS